MINTQMIANSGDNERKNRVAGSQDSPSCQSRRSLRMMMIRTSRFLVLAMVVAVRVVEVAALLSSVAKQVKVILEREWNRLQEREGLRKDRFRKRLCLAVLRRKDVELGSDSTKRDLVLTSALAGEAFEAKGSGLLPANGSLAPVLHWLVFQESSSPNADGLLSKLSSNVDGLNATDLESLNSVKKL